MEICTQSEQLHVSSKEAREVGHDLEQRYHVDESSTRVSLGRKDRTTLITSNAFSSLNVTTLLSAYLARDTVMRNVL